MSILYECDRCGKIADNMSNWGSFEVVRHSHDGALCQDYLLCKNCTTEVIAAIEPTVKKTEVDA